MSHGVRLRAWGPTACFTRPEMKVEQVSYDVPTPSAARGILEAIYWKPEIRWVITAIHVLSPIRFQSVRRNGVASKVTVKGKTGVNAAMKSGSGTLALYADEDRQQFASQVLQRVHYLIEARFEILSGNDAAGKHLAMFERRARSGQCFHRPYFGCREHECVFAWVDPDERIPEPSAPLPDAWRTDPWPEIANANRSSLTGEQDLGYMLHEIDHADGRTPRFYRAIMCDGSLTGLDRVRTAE